jgi:ribonuclease P protein component
MLPKKNRLTRQELDRVFKEGKTISGDYLYLKFLPSEDKALTQISAVVPKTISKKAVIRNRFRRKIYNSILASAKTPPIKGVVVINKDISKLSEPQLNNEINKLLNKTR